MNRHAHNNILRGRTNVPYGAVHFKLCVSLLCLRTQQAKTNALRMTERSCTYLSKYVQRNLCLVRNDSPVLSTACLSHGLSFAPVLLNTEQTKFEIPILA